MVQAALDDEHVLAAICEGKFAAITNDALGGAAILRDQPWRQIHAFEARETKAF